MSKDKKSTKKEVHDKYKCKVRKKYKDRCDLGQWGSMGDGVEVPVRVAPFLQLIITALCVFWPNTYKYKYKYKYARVANTLSFKLKKNTF